MTVRLCPFTLNASVDVLGPVDAQPFTRDVAAPIGETRATMSEESTRKATQITRVTRDR